MVEQESLLNVRLSFTRFKGVLFWWLGCIGQVFVSDIEPLGLDVVELDGIVTDEIVATAINVVQGGRSIDASVDKNFEIGLANLSYAKAVELMEASFSQVM